MGFTAEGERVLGWAHRVLADYGSLKQELSELREGLEGRIRIGAVPVSLPAIALLTAPFAARHPRTRFEVISQTSIEIQRGGGAVVAADAWRTSPAQVSCDVTDDRGARSAGVFGRQRRVR